MRRRARRRWSERVSFLWVDRCEPATACLTGSDTRHPVRRLRIRYGNLQTARLALQVQQMPFWRLLHPESGKDRRAGRQGSAQERVSELPNLPSSKSDPKSLTSQSITRCMRDVRQLLISSLVSCSLNISLRM